MTSEPLPFRLADSPAVHGKPVQPDAQRHQSDDGCRKTNADLVEGKPRDAYHQREHGRTDKEYSGCPRELSRRSIPAIVNGAEAVVLHSTRLPETPRGQTTSAPGPSICGERVQSGSHDNSRRTGRVSMALTVNSRRVIRHPESVDSYSSS